MKAPRHYSIWRTERVSSDAAQRHAIVVHAAAEYTASKPSGIRRWRRLEIIASAFDELPPQYREAFLLRMVCRWSFEAVSREMGVSERMAKVYVARALMDIQHRLDVEEAAG